MDRDPVVEVYRRFKHLDRMIVEAGQDEDPHHAGTGEDGRV